MSQGKAGSEPAICLSSSAGVRPSTPRGGGVRSSCASAVFALSTMTGGTGTMVDCPQLRRRKWTGTRSSAWTTACALEITCIYGRRTGSIPTLTASRGGVQRREGWWWWPYHQRRRSPRPVAIARTRIRRHRSTWTSCSPRMARMAGRSTSSRSFHSATSTDTTPGQVQRARGRRRLGTAAARGQGAGASPSSTLSGRTARRGGGRSTRCATAGPSGGAFSH